jgi:hypothetical protein
MKSPNKGAGSGGATQSIALSHLARHHVLTDAHGRYVALLCRNSGQLQRLPRGIKA